jgi:flagellar protein FlaJ
MVNIEQILLLIPILVFVIPSIMFVVITASRLASTPNRSFDERISRIALKLFDPVVTYSRERERQLEAAFVDKTYRTYAARTYFFTVTAAIAGGMIGMYLVAGVILGLSHFASQNPAPAPIQPIIGFFGGSINPSALEWGAVLFLSLGFFGIIFGVLAYILRWEMPKNKATVRERQINNGMTRMLAFMYALSRGGVAFSEVVETVGKHESIYGENSKEFAVASREMNLFGKDMISSINRMNRRTPSDEFQTFSENLSSVLQSGREVTTFLNSEYERYQQETAERQEDLLESFASIAEGYVTIFVAGVLFLITILLIFGMTTSDTISILRMIAYLGLPLTNIGFMLYLNQRLQTLGIGDSGTTDALDRRETVIIGKPETTGRQKGITDGGAVAQDRENWEILQLYDRLRFIKDLFKSPLRLVIWNPMNILYVSIPAAILLFALRAPQAFQTSAVNLRMLDDFVVQSLLLLFGSFSAVRLVYTRRISRIENAMPELLQRLASLNEAGMTLVESINRVRGGDIGSLSAELNRVWADLNMGANVNDALVRFGRRNPTTSLSRVVTLLVSAMHASGSLGPVLRIAANQARADKRLRERRNSQMLTYLVVIYVSFAVFLMIIAAVDHVLVSSLPSSTPGGGGGGAAGVGGSISLGGSDKSAYTLVFFHAALSQAVVTGFVGGQIGEGNIKDGAKHATVLLGVAYIAFLLLASPAASITVQNPGAVDGDITFNSVDIPEGGFVVAYDSNQRSEIVGVSKYQSPGAYDNVSVTLTRPPSNGEVTMAVHRDSDGNRAFNYDPDAEESPDQPYEEIEIGENGTNARTVRFVSVTATELSNGGFIVVRNGNDAEGDILGTSEYLIPGTHKSVPIALEQEPTLEEVTFVVHQDTNENRIFDYVDELDNGLDKPYAASGTADFETTTVEI